MDPASGRKMGACLHSNGACHSHLDCIEREGWCRLMYTRSEQLLQCRFRKPKCCERSSRNQIRSTLRCRNGRQWARFLLVHSTKCPLYCICRVFQSILMTDKDCLARRWGLGTSVGGNKFCWRCWCYYCSRCLQRSKITDCLFEIIINSRDIQERMEDKVIGTKQMLHVMCHMFTITYHVFTFRTVWANTYYFIKSTNQKQGWCVNVCEHVAATKYSK